MTDQIHDMVRERYAAAATQAATAVTSPIRSKLPLAAGDCGCGEGGCC